MSIANADPIASDPPVALELADTLDRLSESLAPPEFVRRISGICTTTMELEQLRTELSSLRRKHDALGARFTDLHEEIECAGIMQREMLDQTVPTVRRARVDCFQRPSGPVSGDLCQVYRVDSHRIGFFLADATGHGVPAALLATFAKGLLCNPESKAFGDSPAAQLHQLNNAVAAFNLSDCHFLTGIVALFDEDTRVLRWARGGAPHPLLFDAAGHAAQLRGDGPMLGIAAHADFEDCEARLNPGDMLLLHTDGLDFLPVPSTTAGYRDQPRDSLCWYAGIAPADHPNRLDQLQTMIREAATCGTLQDDVSIIALALDP